MIALIVERNASRSIYYLIEFMRQRRYFFLWV